MRQVWLAGAAMACGLAACGPEAAREPATETAAAATPAPAGPNVDAPEIRVSGEFEAPEAVVQALYAQPSIPTDPATIRRFFTEEFVSGLSAAEGPIDFDYRIDAQDGAADGLVLEETAGGPTGGVVEARFTNMGEARVVTWTVCRQDDGALKIVEAGTPNATGFSLRRLLSLPDRDEGC